MEPFTLILAAMLAQTSADAPPAPSSPPPPVAHSGWNGDGSVTRAEYIARFDRMDTNHDGILTREERRAAMPHRGEGPRGRGPRGDDRRDDRRGDDDGPAR